MTVPFYMYVRETGKISLRQCCSRCSPVEILLELSKTKVDVIYTIVAFMETSKIGFLVI